MSNVKCRMDTSIELFHGSSFPLSLKKYINTKYISLHKICTQCSIGIDIRTSSQNFTCPSCWQIPIISSSQAMDKCASDKFRNKTCSICTSSYLDRSLPNGMRCCYFCLYYFSSGVRTELTKRLKDVNLTGVQTTSPTQRDPYELAKEALALNPSASISFIIQSTGVKEHHILKAKHDMGIVVSIDEQRMSKGFPSLNTLTKELLTSLSETKTTKQIAEIYGVSILPIKLKRREFGIRRLDPSYYDCSFNDDEYQVIIGTLLGDGDMMVMGRLKKTARFKFCHQKSDQSYCEWKRSFIKSVPSNIHMSTKIQKTSKEIFYTSVANFSTCRSFYKIWEKFYRPELKIIYGVNGTKCPDISIWSALRPLGLAIYYQDDGNRPQGNGVASIAFHYPGVDRSMVLACLKSNFGIEFRIRDRPGSVSLLEPINHENCDKFYKTVAPFIHANFYHKIPIEYWSKRNIDQLDIQHGKVRRYYNNASSIDSDMVDELIKINVESSFPITKNSHTKEYILAYLRNVRLRPNGTCPETNNGIPYIDELCPHRFTASYATYPSLVDAWVDPARQRRAIMSRLCTGYDPSPRAVRDMIKRAINAPGPFRPSAAAAVINEYAPKRLFDPFAGWLTRSLAAVSSKSVEYFRTCDLQLKSVQAFDKLVEDFTPYMEKPFNAKASHVDTIQYMQNCADNCADNFDMIFSSPPYYNMENYNGIVPTCSYAEWVETFVRPFCSSAVRLVPNGIIVLGIENAGGHPIRDDFISSFKQLGFGCSRKISFAHARNLYVFN